MDKFEFFEEGKIKLLTEDELNNFDIAMPLENSTMIVTPVCMSLHENKEDSLILEDVIKEITKSIKK